MKITKRDIPAGNGSSMFLKIKDGESVKGIFRGEPYEFFQVWENGRSRMVEPNNPEGKSRFRCNFIVQEDGKFVAKTFEFGLTVYNQMADINEEYELETTKVKISRRGSGKDTEWSLLPLLKEPIPPKVLKEIEAVQLNVLEQKPQQQADSANFDGEPPF